MGTVTTVEKNKEAGKKHGKINMENEHEIYTVKERLAMAM